MFRMKRTFCSALLVLSALALLLPLPAAAGGFDETEVSVSWGEVWAGLLDRLGLLSAVEAPPVSVKEGYSSFIDPNGQPTFCDCSSSIDPLGKP
jgi:hypothetical protein